MAQRPSHVEVANILDQRGFDLDHVHRVRALPAAPSLKDVHYAGWLTATEDGHAKLFYWLVLSALPDAPLVVWLNGGPGASSLTGLLIEGIGPLTLQSNGSLTENAFSWSRLAHVVIFEQPVGVGYSFSSASDGGYADSLDDAATQLVTAMLQLYDTHPALRSAPLYITGESFAGKYIPFTASAIAAHNDRHMATSPELTLPLRGLAIGNGVFRPVLQARSVLDFAVGWGYLREEPHVLQPLRDHLDRCAALAEQRRWEEAYSECDFVEEKAYGSAVPFIYDVRESADRFSECSHFMASYLSRPDVREALHVAGRGPPAWWQGDGGKPGNPVSEHLWKAQVVDLPDGMLESLIARFRVLFYTGNADGSSCNSIGVARVLHSLSSSASARKMANSTRCTWKHEGVPAGVAVSGGANLANLVVLNSGHLVPMNVPAAALEMVRIFLSDEPFEAAFCA